MNRIYRVSNPQMPNPYLIRIWKNRSDTVKNRREKIRFIREYHLILYRTFISLKYFCLQTPQVWNMTRMAL